MCVDQTLHVLSMTSLSLETEDVITISDQVKARHTQNKTLCVSVLMYIMLVRYSMTSNENYVLLIILCNIIHNILTSLPYFSAGCFK